MVLRHESILLLVLVARVAAFLPPLRHDDQPARRGQWASVRLDRQFGTSSGIPAKSACSRSRSTPVILTAEHRPLGGLAARVVRNPVRKILARPRPVDSVGGRSGAGRRRTWRRAQRDAHHRAAAAAADCHARDVFAFPRTRRGDHAWRGDVHGFSRFLSFPRTGTLARAADPGVGFLRRRIGDGNHRPSHDVRPLLPRHRFFARGRALRRPASRPAARHGLRHRGGRLRARCSYIYSRASARHKADAPAHRL